MKHLFLFIMICSVLPFSAHAQEPIKIGDSFAYSSFARFGGPYKKGWTMAVDEINDAGGICFAENDCRLIEVISIDHGDNPAQGIRMIEGLIESDQVDILAGTVLTNVTNAIGNYAGNKEVPIFTIWSSILAENGPQNPYMFSMMPVEPHSLASAEIAAKLPAKRWALIGPDIAWGRTGNKLFKKRLKELRPDVEFVTEQWPALMKFNATAEFSALRRAQPEAVFSTLFGTDLFAFIREGQRLSFFEDKYVIATELTQAAHLNVIGAEISQGTWYGTGYPADAIDLPEHKTFYADYLERYGEPPELYSIAGYNIYKAIAEAIKNAETTDASAVKDALVGLVFDTPIGPVTVMEHNHRTNMGVWIGKVDNSSGVARMVDWEYKDAAKYIGKTIETLKNGD